MSVYGDLVVTRHTDERGIETFTAVWSGPPLLLISHELMDDHDPAAFTREGDDLTICGIKLKIIARTERGDYVAERVE